MSDYQRKNNMQFRDTGLAQSAGGVGGPPGGGMGGPPGGGRGRGAGLSSGPRQSSLTEKFNRAAKRPDQEHKQSITVTKKQIVALEKMLSQMRPDYGRSTFGNVNNSFDRDRDRKIRQLIKEKQAVLDQQKGMKSEFNKKGKRGTLTREFNKQSLGRSMEM